MPAPADPKYRQLALDLAAGELERIETLLSELGAAALTLEDAADQPLLEPAPGEVPLWDRLRLHALLPAELAPALITARLAAAGVAAGQLEWTVVPDRLWERAWLERFVPLCFAGRLWVAPHHTTPPATAGQVVLRLDPGLAFGTGGHPTTALCLQAIAAAEWPGRTVIDYGCGSGILGIAAALLGAAYVFGVDHDPQALAATAANAKANAVAGRLQATGPEALPEMTADWVIANILAGTLIALAPELIARLKPGGTLLLSGLLPEQAAAVKAAYEPAVTAWQETSEAGWCALLGRRA